ncbi:MAG: hypothetical protein CBD57_00375 [Candidatus Pelagibacter sp. TMED197]|nr:MAG: hypothetical protein CBD57_00375 [Candidatus Pelagibacter sp. TMED197]|tara:strand:+ start:3459 stop:3722 length:264 start_codon:yes stop_codon:yes gene_type:complete
MKIFFYKTLLVALIFFIVFQITFGSLINRVENKIYEIKSKENIEMIKEKIKNQMEIAINKDEFIKKEDAELINKFINKIQKDLKNQN